MLKEGATKPRLGPDDPWLRFGLSDQVLRIVTAYRGPSRLLDLDNWYTVPFAAAKDRISSERWHRDFEDQHVVKVFMYFSDVDEGAGPFQYVVGSPAGGRYGDLWPWESERWYPPQEKLVQKIPESAQRTITGPAGTVMVCDTSGFHRGGFATERPRVMSYHTYVSPGCPEEPRFEVA